MTASGDLQVAGQYEPEIALPGIPAPSAVHTRFLAAYSATAGELLGARHLSLGAALGTSAPGVLLNRAHAPDGTTFYGTFIGYGNRAILKILPDGSIPWTKYLAMYNMWDLDLCSGGDLIVAGWNNDGDGAVLTRFDLSAAP